MFNRVFNFEKNRSLQNGGLPQLNRQVESWGVPITLTKITQKIVDGDKVETKQDITFRGVVQPLKPEDLQFKPEGLRSFEWLQIHCLSGALNLQTNDKIVFNNKRYKVIDIKDYSLYSYIEYHCCKSYEENNE